MQRETGMKNKKRKKDQPRTKGHFQKFNIHIIEILEREKREWSKKNVWRHNSWQFYTINDKYQITNPESEEHGAEEIPKKPIPKLFTFKLQKTKDKDKILKEVRWKKNS